MIATIPRNNLLILMKESNTSMRLSLAKLKTLRAGIVGATNVRTNIFGKGALADNTKHILKNIHGGNLVRNNIPSKMGRSIQFEENK